MYMSSEKLLDDESMSNRNGHTDRKKKSNKRDFNIIQLNIIQGFFDKI